METTMVYSFLLRGRQWHWTSSYFEFKTCLSESLLTALQQAGFQEERLREISFHRALGGDVVFVSTLQLERSEAQI